MKNKIRLIRTLNALMIFVIMGVLLGAYYQQYFKHEVPCPLCILQRLAMIGICMGLLLNLRFGIKLKYYGLSFLSAIVGAIVAGRQICLHICPGFPIFGIPVFGLSLYTWSFLVFAFSILALVVFLFLYSPDQTKKRSLNFFEHSAFFVIFILTTLNLFTTYKECGFGPCEDVPWPQPKQTITKTN